MRSLALLLAAVLAGCTVGPDYQRPTAPAPAAFKELDGWKPAAPREAASGGAWWSIYDDPVLEGLEQQVEISNQTLKASEAAFRQATALVAEAQAGFFPTATVGASAQRTGVPTTTARGGTGSRLIQNQFGVTPAASWVPDIWGRIRRTVESDVANAQASAADLAAARLSAQGALASDYFVLRIADEQARVLEATVTAYQQTLDITRNQFQAGFAAETDVVTAQTQLQNAQQQLIGLGVQRAIFEHAIAVLTGKPPAELTIARTNLAGTVPVIPAGVPSELLERRPDIAAAERAMQAANAQIGVAEAAYYPDITLSASLGFASTALGNLLAASNAAWAIGAQASETIFDAGLRGAQVAAARAAYDATVANYRETVLAAFQQVEDQLASLRILEQQADAQHLALESARRSVQLTLNQYQAGTVSYTNVVVAQTTALAAEQTALTIEQSRLVASSTLVQALGGGWDRTQLPALDSARK
ncbi:MAG TPA: efflux transporter outer membrane subunit [Stellaceae bacterium]|nr:efflux transporter outer membrane subunit [Stellaceae bacterium]